MESRTVRLFDSAHPLVLGSGAEINQVDVTYETYGELNDSATNAIYICHALTGDAHAAGRHRGQDKPGWWDTIIGPGKPIDTDRFFVISSNLLGGCRGTTGPASVNPETGKVWGLDFPLLQMIDFVTVHRALMHHLGVDKLLAAVGGSLGGMQVLQWALAFPDDMASAVCIAASSRLTAQNIAFSAVARDAITSDPGFEHGHYLEAGTSPDTGLATARMMAHITYLSEEAMDEKFGRRFQEENTGRGFGVDFAVESYLNYQAKSFLSRFDALSYLYLTRVMDYFDPFAEGDVDRLAASDTRFLVVSFDSDWRFDTAHSRRIVRTLESSRVPVTFREISSPWGHDSFLLEVGEYHELMSAFLDHQAEVTVLDGTANAVTKRAGEPR